MPYAITATAEPAAGRVRLEAVGGPPGGVLYMFRRDDAGVGVVRDTSEGTIVWPALSVFATNIIPNPDGSGGLAGVDGTVAGTASVGPALGVFPQSVRLTRTAAATTCRLGLRCGTALAASTGYTVLVALRSDVTITGVNLFLRPDTTSSAGQTALGSTFTLNAGVTQVVEVFVTTTASASTAQAGVAATWSTGGIGNVLDIAAAIVAGDVRTQLSGPFSGAFSWDPAYAPAWTGAPGASASTLSTDTPVVVYDYEAVQGELTDYLLADVDGVQTAVTSLTVPLWGTWLKSPGRPFLNTRCHFVSEGEVARAARRVVVDIEGTKRSIVLSEVRGDKGGALQLAVRDEGAVAGMDRLFDDGMTLMLDVPPSWGVPYRYISVGPVTQSRPMSDGTLNLENMARLFTLGDVVTVDAPIGVTVVDAGRTYATLATLYGSYAAMAATNDTYIDLALGT